MEKFVERTELTGRVELALRRNPVVSLLGPRQCGKTTLARQIADERGTTWFDLEDPRSARRLEEPLTALEPLTGLVGDAKWGLPVTCYRVCIHVNM